MTLRPAAVIIALLLGAFGISCKKQESALIVVHVLRNPSRVLNDLEEATFKFGSGKPHVAGGEGIMIATYEGPFRDGLKQAGKMDPDVIILTPVSDLPAVDSTVKEKLGTSTSICQDKSAYVPTWVMGETREAANLYVQFLSKNCGVAEQPDRNH